MDDEGVSRNPDGSEIAHQLAQAAPEIVGGELLEQRIFSKLFPHERAAVTIGRFRLLDRIGAGAMGEVYAAYDEHLDRKVAIKLLLPSARGDREGARSRLLREARGLAQLSHPNVVQIYDSGEHEERIFIAMELIRGTSLDVWLSRGDSDGNHDDGDDDGSEDVEARPWREVLECFVQAGRGLQAAHQAGLVHRDFKPANVLVGDDGRARVVDFGLARLAVSHTPAPAEAADTASPAEPALAATLQAVADGSGSPGSGSQTLTALGSIVGTPAYMSPEQMHGQAADQRSDQFSFCAALYEALYRERAFQGASLAELKEAVERNEVPPAPSATPVPAVLHGALARGLARQPDQRFATMEELLAVLREPLVPRQRRAPGVFAAAVLLTGAVATYVAVAEQDEPCAAVTDDFQALWTTERQASIKAAFLATGLPYAGQAWQTTAAAIDGYSTAWHKERVEACESALVTRSESADLYDRRVICLNRGRDRLAGLLASFAEPDDEVVERAVQASQALPDLDVCRDPTSLVFGLEPPDDPETREAVAQVRRQLEDSYAQELLGRFQRADEIATEQLAVAKTLGYPPIDAEALARAAEARSRRDTGEDIEQATTMLLRAIDIAEAHRHDHLVATSWHRLGFLGVSHDGTTERGHRWARRAAATVERIGDPPSLRSRVLHLMGRLHHKDEDFAAASARYREALAAFGENSGPGRVHAAILHDLGNALDRLGDTDQVSASYEQALQLAIDDLGPYHPEVARINRDFAAILINRAHYDRARELLTSALQSWEQLDREPGIEMGRLHYTLASLEEQTGDLDRAHHHAISCQRIYERLLEPGHPQRANPYIQVGIIEFRRRNFAAALEQFEAALAIQRQRLGGSSFIVAVTWINIAETRVKLGRHDAALEGLATAEEILKRSQVDLPIAVALIASVRGQALAGKGQRTAALTALESAVAKLAGIPGYPAEHASALWALARVLTGQSGELSARARALVEKARALYAKQGPAAKNDLVEIRAWMGGFDKDPAR